MENVHFFYILYMMCRLLMLFLAAMLPMGAVEVVNAVGQHMDALEAGEGVEARQYCTAQYQLIEQALAESHFRIRVMSYNMLYNQREWRRLPENRWVERLPRIVALIEVEQPDIIGTQELYAGQVADLLDAIGAEYAFYGRGTLDGNKAGEINGIFYHKARFSRVDEQVWWMWPAPAEPGFDPSVRTLTMVRLRDHKTGADLALFNTHFPSTSPDGRAEAACFIVDRTAEIKDAPVVVTGDFNLFPNRPELAVIPYRDGEWIHQILTSGRLSDANSNPLLGYLGPLSTYTNDGNERTPFIGEGIPGIILDHIYISSELLVLVHAVDAARVDGHFPSDHMPVIADLILR